MTCYILFMAHLSVVLSLNQDMMDGDNFCHTQSCSKYASFSDDSNEWIPPNALFDSNFDEVSQIKLEVISGDVPNWLDGSLYRVGPGIFEFGARKVNTIVDALSKIHKWTFNKEGPIFSASFLKSSIYNRTMQSGNFVPMPHLGQVEPSLSTFEVLKVMLYDDKPDNNNIAPWNLRKSGITITAESPLYIDIDCKTLNFLEKYLTKSNDTGFFEKEILSASHFWRHPSSGDSINYKIVIPYDKGLISGSKGPAYHLYRYKEDYQGHVIANLIGKVPIENNDIRVVHTLGATEHYVVLPRFSLYVELNHPVDISQNIKISPLKSTIFDVLSLKDGNRKSFVFGAYEAQHIFNCYERYNDENELEIIVDYPTIEDITGVPNKNIFEILNIKNLKNPNYSYKENWEPYTKFKIRRFILNMDTGKGTIYEYPIMWSPKNLEVEFPYINDAYRGLPYCFVYLQTWNHDANNAMGLMKVDMCTERSIGWQEKNKFPVEPVFAARPGACEEDDGIILSPVLDSTDNSTSLYIWNATNLEVIAIISTPITVPFSLHGIWINGV